ncbi:MAG: lipoprotein [Gammaproteobacteria bacterium]|nr:lipoprotein [Gammaproteobacteria bacterium]
MKRLFTALAACAFLVASFGCGQSGPLYIPGNPSKIQQQPPQAESTAEEEADENDKTQKE